MAVLKGVCVNNFRLVRYGSYALLAVSAITILANERFGTDATIHTLLSVASILCLAIGGALYFVARQREKTGQRDMPPVRRFDRMDFSMGKHPDEPPQQ